MTCWCGNANLTIWGQSYLHCNNCQTLIATTTQPSPDLYNQDYWFAHQTEDLNCPDILTRSRTDLAERAIHWFRSLLRFKLPPAKILEIGCAHGGFVAMLNQAGYQAIGLELNPDIVKLARNTFSIEVLTGPIEDQTLPRQSLDAIAMFDVMEHLPNPLQTLGKCLDLLKPDGILLIQTPSYPEKKTLADLKQTDHKFPMMLDPNEHPFLFSPTSAKELFHQLKAKHITFIPAIFDFYDMSFAVSRNEIHEFPLTQQEAALTSTVPGKMLQALLDSDARRLDLLEKYRAQLLQNAPSHPLSDDQNERSTSNVQH